MPLGSKHVVILGHQGAGLCKNRPCNRNDYPNKSVDPLSGIGSALDVTLPELADAEERWQNGSGHLREFSPEILKTVAIKSIIGNGGVRAARGLTHSTHECTL